MYNQVSLVILLHPQERVLIIVMFQFLQDFKITYTTVTRMMTTEIGTTIPSKILPLLSFHDLSFVISVC